MKTLRIAAAASSISAPISGATACACFGLVLGATGPAHGQVEHDFILVDSLNANPLAGGTRLSDNSDRGTASLAGAGRGLVSGTDRVEQL